MELSLYVTHEEREAYDLAVIMAVSRIRCRVEPNRDKHGKPFYAVVVEDTEQAQNRATKLRDAWLNKGAW